MRHTETKDYYTDDLTGKEIDLGGWALVPLRTDSRGEVLHFQSLSNLLIALNTKATLFGLTEDHILPL